MKPNMAAFLVIVMAPSGRTATWVVAKDGTGHFVEIAEALASDLVIDGDTITVRSGTYRGFVLSKGVMIVPASTSFSIATKNPDDVTIENIAEGKRVGLSGATLVSDDYGAAFLRVQNCAGEVLLDGIEFSPYYSQLSITDSSNVAITQLSMDSYWSAGARVSISRSQVRMSDVLVRGAYGTDCNGGPLDGCDGGNAVEVSHSRLVLARCRLYGGRGSDAYADFDTGQGGTGGDGGDALRAATSDVVILGSADDILQGGDGGDAGDGGFAYYGCGGNGGNGFTGGAAVASLVRLNGGKSGYYEYSCYGHPESGQPWEGELTYRSDLPYLDVDQLLRPGDSFLVSVQAAMPSYVTLFGSSRGGFVDDPRFTGPPLSLMIGGWFALLGQGRTSQSGHIDFLVSLEDSLQIEGFPINFQAVAVPDTGPATYLSNATVRIVGNSGLEDCNHNGRPDSDDIAQGDSEDCDQNGVPDECQDTSADCNHNGRWDTCDIFYGWSQDANHNGVPDECELDVYYVDDDGPGDPGPGDVAVSDPLEDGSAEHPFDAIQEAVDATVYGNTIVIRKGTYRGAGNRQISIRRDGLTVRGEGGPEGVIVTGDDAGPIFEFQGGGIDDAALIGVTLSDTKAASGGGGAIVIANSKPMIRQCVIRNNVADKGAGIYCASGDAVIEDCEIADNHVLSTADSGSGGGIYVAGAAGATIRRCRLLGNAAGGTGDSGGGIFIGVNERPVRILGCTFVGNRADHGGGVGIASEDAASGLEIADCLFMGNVGHGSGGALIAYCNGLVLRNVTMVNNRATSRGGALYLGRDTRLVQCILTGNEALKGSNAWLEYSNFDLDVSYSDVVGGDGTIDGDGIVTWGPGNIDADPRFVFPPAGNFHLRLDSPCRNSGDPAFVPAPDETDLDGEARVLGPIVDMGADEVGSHVLPRREERMRLRW